jgi:hypothetical protein
MSNNLKSAGISLKNSAKNLTAIFIINLISSILLFAISLINSINFNSKLIFCGVLAVITILINLILQLVLIGNLNDSGNSLILISESPIFLSEEQPSIQINKRLKTKNLKGKIKLIQDIDGNYFLALENRRYYYDTVLSADNSLNHYNETGNLLEDGLIQS